MATIETNGHTTNGYDQFIADQENGETPDDQEPGSPRYAKQVSVLDGLTEHRADRVGILLNNLP